MTTATTELTLENRRLEAELHARLEELQACHQRMLDAIYAERRRIERDLHDGTQGRLVSVAMSLGLLEAKLQADPEAAKPIVREARQAVTVALQELRDLSQGCVPSVLAERGLAAALAQLCDRAAVPTHLDLCFDRPLASEIEVAAYFVVSEALTNAAKHAHASEVRAAAWLEGKLLVLEVTDNGIGGASADAGSGLAGLVNRIEALGGQLIVSSPPGGGTTLRAEIPWGIDIV
jgi:signal transduction histidine kinase